MKNRIMIAAALLVTCGWTGTSLPAQTPVTPQRPAETPPQAPVAPVVPVDPETKPMKAGSGSPSGREARLADYLTGATFTGNFTLDGKENEAMKPESYTIQSCEKLPEEDLYSMKVAIKYGNTDGVFPMQLKIIWSGNTPVITLDSVWIPGLGTFSSRVLIQDGRYAGTWQHDAKGGHLIGKITPRVE